MSTFTKKVAALTIAFALAYTASVIGFTYGVVDLSKLGHNANYNYLNDHININEEYAHNAGRKRLAELAHWTGHRERGNREGSDMYHKEVVAELTVVMLSEVFDFKYADKSIERSAAYLDYHHLAKTSPEVDIKQAQDDAEAAAVMLIRLFISYGMVEGETFDVVKAVFPDLAKINRGGKDAQ